MLELYDDNSPRGNQVEDKHKDVSEIDDSEIDDSQMSDSAEIQLSPTESSATPFSLFQEVIDEMGNDQSSPLYITDPLCFYMERYPRLAPERDEGKETEASFPQAWSMIDFPNFKASLIEAEKMFPKRSVLLLIKLIHSFESAFSGVSFAWEDISKDPLSSTLDVSLCPGYATFVDWIVNHGPRLSVLGDFIVWAFGHILDSLFRYRWKKGAHSSTHLSDVIFQNSLSNVAIFAALALVLRSQPHILPMYIPALNKIDLWYQKKGAVTCPIRVWIVHQVSFVSLHAAFFSWVRVLLPQLKEVCPRSREFILQLVEKIFEDPGAKTQLVESPTLRDISLFPRDLFEILLRVTFPATSSATEEDTARLLNIYTSVKDVALACALIENQLPRYMFTLSLSLAGEGNPGLAKEAIEIAMWCMENVDCWEDLYDLCREKLRASIALLKALTENGKLNFNHLPSSNKHFIQHMFTVSLTLAGQGNHVLDKENAKICIWCLTQHVDCWRHLRHHCRKNLEASVALLKALVDEWPALSLKLPSSGKPLFIQQIFTVSFGLLAGEENPVLAKEATEIAIWSLTQHVDCWTCWENLCHKENPKASVVLLIALVEKGNVLSFESTEAMERITQKMVTSSLEIAREDISLLDTLVVHGYPVLLGKSSRVAIWFLTEILDFCSYRWGHLYMEILKESGDLLNSLVKKCKHIYRTLKLRSGGAPEREAMKQVFQQIFTFSLRLAGKDIHRVLAKEAKAIAIWSLTKNFDCCTHWDNLYEENIEASVGLLKKLVREWDDHSPKLISLSPTDTLTLSQTIKSFRLKNQKAIALGGANCDLCKKADKFCKLILGRLSRGSCSLKCACITSVLLVAALVPFYLWFVQVVGLGGYWNKYLYGI